MPRSACCGTNLCCALCAVWADVGSLGPVPAVPRLAVCCCHLSLLLSSSDLTVSLRLGSEIRNYDSPEEPPSLFAPPSFISKDSLCFRFYFFVFYLRVFVCHFGTAYYRSVFWRLYTTCHMYRKRTSQRSIVNIVFKTHFCRLCDIECNIIGLMVYFANF